MRYAVVVLAVLMGSVASAAVPVSLGLEAGVIAGSDPWDYSPALALNAAVGLPNSNVSIIGRVDGWSLGAAGSPASTETTVSFGAQYTHELGREVWWSAAGAAAASFRSRAGEPLQTVPGVLITPALEFSTRRRTLGLQLSGTALFTTDGVRFGAMVGAIYTFL